MKLIPLTMGQFAIVINKHFKWLNQWKWHALKQKGKEEYYAVRSEIITLHPLKSKIVCMHRLIMNAPEGMLVDHRNHNGLDNRPRNLRLATRSQNASNKKLHMANNTTGYKGVCLRKSNNIYEVHITANKKRHYVGGFKNAVDAAKAYDKAAIKYHGEFALLNFPKNSRLG